MLDTEISNTPDTDLLWHLTGARSGPALLVTGDLEKLAPVVERLQLLPSLVYLRGALMVGSKNTKAEADEVLSLSRGEPSDFYWYILARATELGMISGRGIPTNLLAA